MLTIKLAIFNRKRSSEVGETGDENQPTSYKIK